MLSYLKINKISKMPGLRKANRTFSSAVKREENQDCNEESLFFQKDTMINESYSKKNKWWGSIKNEFKSIKGKKGFHENPKRSYSKMESAEVGTFTESIPIIKNLSNEKDNKTSILLSPQRRTGKRPLSKQPSSQSGNTVRFDNIENRPYRIDSFVSSKNENFTERLYRKEGLRKKDKEVIWQGDFEKKNVLEILARNDDTFRNDFSKQNEKKVNMNKNEKLPPKSSRLARLSNKFASSFKTLQSFSKTKAKCINKKYQKNKLRRDRVMLRYKRVWLLKAQESQKDQQFLLSRGEFQGKKIITIGKYINFTTDSTPFIYSIAKISNPFNPSRTLFGDKGYNINIILDRNEKIEIYRNAVRERMINIMRFVLARNGEMMIRSRSDPFAHLTRLDYLALSYSAQSELEDEAREACGGYLLNHKQPDKNPFSLSEYQIPVDSIVFQNLTSRNKHIISKRNHRAEEISKYDREENDKSYFLLSNGDFRALEDVVVDKDEERIRQSICLAIEEVGDYNLLFSIPYTKMTDKEIKVWKGISVMCRIYGKSGLNPSIGDITESRIAQIYRDLASKYGILNVIDGNYNQKMSESERNAIFNILA